jgi:hypothetical protein
MKTVKLLSITGLFFMALVFGACNQNAKNDDNTASSGGLDQPTLEVTKKDSATHNDTIVTPADDNNSMNKNNPDITK